MISIRVDLEDVDAYGSSGAVYLGWLKSAEVESYGRGDGWIDAYAISRMFPKSFSRQRVYYVLMMLEDAIDRKKEGRAVYIRTRREFS